MTNDNFDNRLNKAMEEDAIGIPIEQTDNEADINSGLAVGMRIGLEFVSGTVVGMAIGYGIDRYFNTTPWFLLIFTILGFCAGIMNIYRSINNIDEGIGLNRQKTLTPKDKGPTS
jgi:F0F1-type ATP synthase assembly protein I